MTNPPDFINMKKLLFLLMVLGSFKSVCAQADIKRADLYFSRAYYADAIPLYEELLPKNKSSQLIKNLADSYYHTFQMKSAARWYQYLANHYADKLNDSYYFKLSQSLKAIGEDEQADDALIAHYSKKGYPEKAALVKTQRTYLDNIAAIGDRFEIVSLALNTESSEFGAAVVDSLLVYAASKKSDQMLSKLYRWNNQSYLDLYSHPLEKSNLGDTISKSFSKRINTNLHEGTFAITKDRKTIYFTRNSKQKTDEKISHLMLYKAEWVEDEWKNIEELPFNGEDFSTEHPALNPDETKLYFSSDREGGQGGFDLYYVDIQKDGYGNPVNLGATINTDKKEQFPHIDAEGNLYFASNGHPGYGLLDIFKSEMKDGELQKPNNLGFPVNSGYDDFSLALNPDRKSGYFSSNRPSGKGSDDIYSFKETKPLVIEDCMQFIAGIITDKTTNQPLANAKVELLNSVTASIESISTSSDGSFKFSVECATNYKITATKTGYETASKAVVTDKERKAVKDASLALLSEEEIAKQEAIALQKEKEEAEKKAIAEAKRLKELELKAEQEKLRKEKVRLQKEAEQKEKQAIAQEKAKQQRRKEIEKIIAQEEGIVKDKERTLLQTGEIHFDYGMWYLRRETRARLDKVVKIMKDHPGMVLEIGTHTDIRGNSNYNRELSQKRADAAKEYLVKNGIDSSRVVSKGYGESQPIVHCDTENSCTEEDHEWNRRCELVVVQWN